MQAIDRLAVKQYDIPSLILMEQAGRGIAQFIVQNYSSLKNSTISIVCGTGHNGGDGFVAARYLQQHDFSIHLYIIGDVSHMKTDALINYHAALAKSISCEVVEQGKKDFQRLERSGLIVDALFGVGLSRPVENLYRDIIERINVLHIPVVAVDVPSGLNATTGEVLGVAIKAKHTLTLVCPKTGFLTAQGPQHVGSVEVIDIGIPDYVIKKVMDGA